MIDDDNEQGEEKYPFILRVKNAGNGITFATSDDDTLRIWKKDSLFQQIPHPNCVWDVDFRGDFEYPGGDRDHLIMTACGDGVRQ